MQKDFRNSTYFSLTWLPSPVATLVTTTYYQPLFNNIADYRIFHQFSLVFKATKHFAITTDWNYLFDKFAASGVTGYNYAVSNGFSYRF